MNRLVRDLLVFAVAYFVILFFVPKRWLPEDGSRTEWKALLAVGLVTVLVFLRPELLGVVVLVWFGEIIWHRWQTRGAP